MGWWLESSTDSQFQGIGSCCPGFAVSTRQAEVLSCFLSLTWAKQIDLFSICIFTDSCYLVDLLRDSSSCNMDVFWSIRQIWSLGKLFSTCVILKVDRDRVYAANHAKKISKQEIRKPQLILLYIRQLDIKHRQCNQT